MKSQGAEQLPISSAKRSLISKATPEKSASYFQFNPDFHLVRRLLSDILRIGAIISAMFRGHDNCHLLALSSSLYTCMPKPGNWRTNLFQWAWNASLSSWFICSEIGLAQSSAKKLKTNLHDVYLCLMCDKSLYCFSTPIIQSYICHISSWYAKTPAWPL